jgi:endonuclease YncB( thermonuclease family)
VSTWIVYGTLIRAIDGDTVVADLDLGWKVWFRDVRIRLEGINAPERGKPGATEATAELQAFEGERIKVASHSVDKYGRVLATVTVLNGEIDLSDHMLDGGFAEIYEL